MSSSSNEHNGDVRHRARRREIDQSAPPPHHYVLYASDPPPDVGTAWLLLSHAGFFAISIQCAAAAVILIGDIPKNASLKSEAIGWLVLALLFKTWTAYALIKTWRANHRVKRPVFGDIGFSTLFLLILLSAGKSIWTIVTVSTL